MNEKDINKAEELSDEGPVEVKFQDKRRFDDSGERISVETESESAEATATEMKEEEVEVAEVVEEPKEKKSPDVIRLEGQLAEITTRCEAAENKLQEVQKRFEEERANLEKETTEMRGRMKKSLEQQADQGRFNFLTKLLPVLDNLGLAITAAEQDASLENMIDGVRGTARSFEQALISVGVEPVPSVGEKFDPQIHEAVDMVEVEADKSGLITHEFARGYTFNERLLRPARVQVGTAKS